MKNIIAGLLFLFAVSVSFAVDATKQVTSGSQFGDWSVVEFAGGKQMLYRISSYSINEKNTNLVFDFLPSNKCVPSNAIMISKLKAYDKGLSDGKLVMAYKVPSQEEGIEIVSTVMSKGDPFLFIAFEKLSVQMLSQARDQGRLAIWIPPSGDGVVKRSPNTYFSLNGFFAALQRAQGLCASNM